MTKLTVLPKLRTIGDNGRAGIGRLVVPVGFLEGPGAARTSVNPLDIAQAPPDLGGRVGLPVRARAGHLAARQGLRDAVGAAGVLRVVDPAALPVPQVHQAAELALRIEA